MKFDKIIRRSYFLLEQDEQGNMPPTPSAGGQGAPASSGDSKVAVAGLEKVGKKLEDQVENAEDQLFTMSKDLISVFNQVLKVDNIDLNDHPNLKKIIDSLTNASDVADAKTGLPAIQKIIKDYTQDVTKKDQPFNF
jgi:hypothetical protein